MQGRRREIEISGQCRVDCKFTTLSGNYSELLPDPIVIDNQRASIYLTARPDLTNYIININPADFWPRVQISYDRQLSEISAY